MAVGWVTPYSYTLNAVKAACEHRRPPWDFPAKRINATGRDNWYRLLSRYGMNENLCPFQMIHTCINYRAHYK